MHILHILLVQETSSAQYLHEVHTKFSDVVMNTYLPAEGSLIIILPSVLVAFPLCTSQWECFPLSVMFHQPHTTYHLHWCQPTLKKEALESNETVCVCMCVCVSVCCILKTIRYFYYLHILIEQQSVHAYNYFNERKNFLASLSMHDFNSSLLTSYTVQYRQTYNNTLHMTPLQTTLITWIALQWTWSPLH